VPQVLTFVLSLNLLVFMFVLAKKKDEKRWQVQIVESVRDSKSLLPASIPDNSKQYYIIFDNLTLKSSELKQSVDSDHCKVNQPNIRPNNFIKF
jgi:hypothetical protein